MRRAVAVATIALLSVLPAGAQHLTGQQRSAEHSSQPSSAPHFGHPPQLGFRGPSSFTPPGRLPGIQRLPHRTLPAPGFVPGRAPLYSGFRAPDLRQRPPYQPGYRDNPDRRNRYRDRDHRRGDHHDRDRHQGFYVYPTWTYPYTWVNSFTLSGWDNDSDYLAPDSNGPASDYAQAPQYPESPYPDYNGGPSESAPVPSGPRRPYEPEHSPSRQSAQEATPSATIASSEPLTLIFKDGRTPEKIHNYIMNGTTLTNLDPQRFEEIPLDQVDVAATAKLNRTHGITFQVPGAPGE